ncbi:MAG: hypothetical protein M1827_003290 [Pycnora praestabilis]|nr:MAG: hypothetical protein M1827_003290 [Pycnora praestabilis]
MSQQNNPQSRQPTSYPSPHSYPSPSISAYAYPPPQQGQNVEPYRASPTGSHVSLPSLNLPPIRSIDPRQQQQQGQVAMGSPLQPPPVAQMGQYYHNQGQSLPPPQQHPNVTSSPHDHQPLRYPLPAPDGRIMSGGRHKKEIKRRTKTGCLTCRKRRIKCDEAHPTCRNCQKSKRECLGYDPIFKTQPGPAAIQPAPSSAPSMHPASATSSTASPYPPGYAPAVSGGYAPALSTGASSPGSSVEPYDYSAAIDPALEAAGPSQMSGPSAPYDGAQGFRPDLKQGLESASPYSSAASDNQNQRGGATPAQNSIPTPGPSSIGTGFLRTSSAHTSSPAKRIKIDDLLSVGGVIPPPLTPPNEHASSISPATYDEIKQIYLTLYGPAIDKFLETRWFGLRGLPRLLYDSRLCDQFATLIERFHSTRPDDQEATMVTQGVEAIVIWSLMTMCRSAVSAGNGSEGQVEREELEEVTKRLDVFENLVSGQFLDTNPAPALDHARYGPSPVQQQKYRECEFWRLIGKFLTLRDDEASSAKEIDDTLGTCRMLLDGQENRDVIYSIAIARHIGQRVAEFPDNLQQPTDNDEQDVRTKLFVAKKFIEDEAAGMGTTQVIQRLCGMATRSWTVAR